MKINGIVGKYSGPIVQAAITIAEVGVRNQLISLLFDTGATYTQLSERLEKQVSHRPEPFRQEGK